MNTSRHHPSVLVALALSVALVSGVAIAQQAAPQAPSQPARAHDGMHDRMAQLDTDHDGRISRKEAAAKPEMAQRFDTLDADRDGFLDRGDFQAHRQQQHDACFARADADKDGKLDRAEFDASRRQCPAHGGKRSRMHGGGDPTPPAG
jgi:Ca2+-binding EF-hand superfamily protein